MGTFRHKNKHFEAGRAGGDAAPVHRLQSLKTERGKGQMSAAPKKGTFLDESVKYINDFFNRQEGHVYMNTSEEDRIIKYSPTNGVLVPIAYSLLIGGMKDNGFGLNSGEKRILIDAEINPKNVPGDADPVYWAKKVASHSKNLSINNRETGGYSSFQDNNFRHPTFVTVYQTEEISNDFMKKDLDAKVEEFTQVVIPAINQLVSVLDMVYAPKK